MSLLVILSLSAAAGAVAPRQETAAAQNDYSTRIEGTVFDQHTGQPIGNAHVLLIDLGLELTTDTQGQFTWHDIPIPEPIYPVTITVQAPDYGLWTIKDVRLFDNDILYLEADLTQEPRLIEVPEPVPERSPEARQLHTFVPSFSAEADEPNQPLPDTIRVIITGEAYCSDSMDKYEAGDYTVEVIDFKEYAKHVLPNEWYASWPRESLRAGGLAVKAYAWYYIARGGKWDDGDVMDSTCDQYYNPNVSYDSTNRAVDFTWPWRITDKDGDLFLTHYLDTYERCVDYGWQGSCMGQWDTYYHATGNNGYEQLLWDEMVLKYYWDSELTYVPFLPKGGFMLRFYGNGWGDYDRVKILIDDAGAGLPADVGDGDFTLEWWMKALAEENTSDSCSSGAEAWMNGNVLFDRDVSGRADYGEYGVALMNGTAAFGVHNGTTGTTLCGSTTLADGQWHHVALTRTASDGHLRIYVDGQLDAEGAGPTGALSYRDGRETSDPEQDPYLVIGARKGDMGTPFAGWLDDVRLSSHARYDAAFAPPSDPLQTDEYTLALYNFDEGHGNVINDRSSAAGGPSNGTRIYGGDPVNGPEWEISTLFPLHVLFLPMLQR